MTFNITPHFSLFHCLSAIFFSFYFFFFFFFLFSLPNNLPPFSLFDCLKIFLKFRCIFAFLIHSKEGGNEASAQLRHLPKALEFKPGDLAHLACRYRYWSGRPGLGLPG
jgi:hypothetical protein